MQLVETKLCPMGNRKFVPHPVGADAHIGPLESCEFAEDPRKNGAFCRADVGIGPYKRMRKCIWICRKHNFRR